MSKKNRNVHASNSTLNEFTRDAVLLSVLTGAIDAAVVYGLVALAGGNAPLAAGIAFACSAIVAFLILAFMKGANMNSSDIPEEMLEEEPAE